MRRPTFADFGVASVLGEDDHYADGMRSSDGSDRPGLSRAVMTMPGLELEFTQRMRLAPASVAVLSMLSLPQGDLDEFIAARVATNPLLERGAPRRCRWCAAPAYGGRCVACDPRPVPVTGSDRAWIETLRTDARAAVPTRLGGAVNAVADHLDPRGLLDAGVDDIAEAAGRSP